MNIPFFNYPQIYLDRKEEYDVAINDALSKGAYIMQEHLENFEYSLGAYLGVKHVMGVADGTMALLLSQTFKTGNATVTICHSKTKPLKDYVIKADILIAATGVANLITPDMVNNNVDIIDVGINRVEDDSDKGFHICGDVDFQGCLGKVNSITPVPGGVGPMTIMMLLINTIKSAENVNN